MSRKAAEALYAAILRHVESQMGNQITNNFQLDEYISRIVPHWTGSLPRTRGLDELGSVGVGNGMIINTTDEGEHWTAVWRFGKCKMLFYDSFGRPFKQLFGEERRCLKDTDDDVEQGMRQMNCGQRCIAWIILCVHFGYGYAKWI